MSFEQIMGQKHAKALATAWLVGQRLPHAILICGPAGTGKRRFALELAKAIDCREGEGEACDRCASCRRMESLLHPDLLVLLPLPKREEEREPPPWGEVWREVRPRVQEYLEQESILPLSYNIPKMYLLSMQREMSYAPVEGPWKIGLIFEAEYMHPAGANALLKVLEEPPGRAIFILVSAMPGRLFPTVLSRCQRLTFRRLGQAELRDYFCAAGLKPERLESAVRMAAGSWRRAVQVATGALDEVCVQAEKFLKAGLARRDESYWTLIDELGTPVEREWLERFLEVCGIYLRDLFLLAQGREEEIALVDRRDFLAELQSHLDPGKFETLAIEVDRAFESLRRNANARLALVDLWRCLGRCSLGGVSIGSNR